MNILILSGSPRKKGLVSQMLDIMREEAEKRGDEVETIRTNDLNIKHAVLTYMEQQAGFMLWQMEDEKHIDNDSHNV